MKIAFIGLGIMGKPMALNLLKAGHQLRVYDQNEATIAELKAAGATACSCSVETAEGVDARCFGVLGRPNIRSFWNWEFLFPGKSQQQIREFLPATTRLLDLTIDIALSPMLGDQDLEDLEQALAKVLNHRTSKQAVIEKSSREGLAA